MEKRKKCIALFVAFILISGILISFHFILKNTYHHCGGENCFICTEIKKAVHFISKIKYIPITIFIMSTIYIFAIKSTLFKKYLLIKPTLVTLNVKLLN